MARASGIQSQIEGLQSRNIMIKKHGKGTLLTSWQFSRREQGGSEEGDNTLQRYAHSNIPLSTKVYFLLEMSIVPHDLLKPHL